MNKFMNKKIYKEGAFIIVDSRQKSGYHDKTLESLEQKVELVSNTLPVGDYAIMTSRMLDVVNNRKAGRYASSKKYKGYNLDDDFSIDARFLGGTYTRSVDTKKNTEELYKCLCVNDEHNSYRFENELMVAKNYGIKLHILIVADNKFRTLEDIKKYTGVYDGQKSDAGKMMLQQIEKLTQKYPVVFEYVEQENLGDRIISILSTDECLSRNREGACGLALRDVEILTYDFDDEMKVEVSKDNVGNCYKVYLYHKDCGVKQLIFGIPSTDISHQELLAVIRNNLAHRNYISQYWDEHMPEYVIA